jgi:acetylornithine/succinyldiaminopimelate/putrescine aminotransferase
MTTSHAFKTTGDYCPFMPVFSPPQVMFARGQGTELWDVDGKRYLDFLGGLAVISLGHSHPAISEAIAEQARTLMHVSNLFANPVATEVAFTIDRCSVAVGRSSSATRVPRRTKRPSSWPASSAGAAAMSW